MRMKYIFILLLIAAMCLSGCHTKENSRKDNKSVTTGSTPIQMQQIVDEWAINYDKIEKQDASNGVCSEILFDSELRIEAGKKITISGVLLGSSGEEFELAAENQLHYMGHVGKVLRCQTTGREHILIPDGSNILVTGHFDNSKNDIFMDCEIIINSQVSTKYQPNVMAVSNGENTVLVQGEIISLEKIEPMEPKDFSLYEMYRVDATYKGVISENGEKLPFLCNADEDLEVGKRIALKAVVLTHENEKILGVNNNYYVFE